MWIPCPHSRNNTILIGLALAGNRKQAAGLFYHNDVVIFINDGQSIRNGHGRHSSHNRYPIIRSHFSLQAA